MKDDTEDVDETQDSEHFDARTSFLTLCQGNHYQFDQLRRAKHSSMMVLYHLHNPDAPKFTPNCSNCRVEINAGYRHHCSACDVNFCTPCLRYHGPNLHQHALRAVDMSGSAPTQLTEEQKRERERSIQMHMALLVHASSCVAPSCASKSCQKLKVRFFSFLCRWLPAGLTRLLFAPPHCFSSSLSLAIASSSASSALLRRSLVSRSFSSSSAVTEIKNKWDTPDALYEEARLKPGSGAEKVRTIDVLHH
jgi:hypothetical protein